MPQRKRYTLFLSTAGVLCLRERGHKLDPGETLLVSGSLTEVLAYAQANLGGQAGRDKVVTCLTRIEPRWLLLTCERQRHMASVPLAIIGSLEGAQQLLDDLLVLAGRTTGKTQVVTRFAFKEGLGDDETEIWVNPKVVPTEVRGRFEAMIIHALHIE